MVILKRKFFARDTLTVAKEMLGKTLCRRYGNLVLKGNIVEVEAYTQDDQACHAYNGMTQRNKFLFGKPGTAYIYFIYGMHYCLNIVTDRKNFASGVLIRALEPIQYIDNTNGPARITRAMNISKLQNGCDVTTGKDDIWLENSEPVSEENIIQTTRIGIKLASDYPWRFYVRNNKWVSKK